MNSTDVPGLHAGDLVACQRLLRAGSRSFHTASLLLPREVRGAVAVFYAFCRAADDLVDSGDASRWTIVNLRDRVSAVYSDDAIADPIERALQAVVRHHQIPQAVFDTLLEGFAWEIEGRRYDSLSDVRAYSVRVAATIGAGVCHILGCRDPQVLARACDLGVAMQFTNIARDVGEDARNRRLYLPRDWMRDAGIDTAAWLAAPSFSPALGTVVERLLNAAHELYERAESGIARLPYRSQAAIRSARAIYADIGRSIASAGFDSVSRRAYTSATRKLFLVGKSIIVRPTARRSEHSEPPLQEAMPLVAAAAAARPPRRQSIHRSRLRPTQYLMPGKLQQETGP
jgi:phytoene synthase